MSHATFISQWSEALELGHIENPEQFEIPTERWDSVALITTIALIDELYGKVLEGDRLTKVKSLGELLILIEASPG